MSTITTNLILRVAIKPSVPGALYTTDDCVLVGEFWRLDPEVPGGISRVDRMVRIGKKDYDLQFVAIETSLWRDSALRLHEDPQVAAERYALQSLPKLILQTENVYRGLTIFEVRRSLIAMDMLDRAVDRLQRKAGSPVGAGQVLTQYARALRIPIILANAGNIETANGKRYQELNAVSAAQEIDRFFHDWVLKAGRWSAEWRARVERTSPFGARAIGQAIAGGEGSISIG